MSDSFIGIDLGGTHIRAALVTSDGEILRGDLRPTPAADGVDAVIDAMADIASLVGRAGGGTWGDVTAIGIGAPGPLNWRTGVVFSPPNLAGWTNVPLAELMGERLGVPCFVDNDANCACLGERWVGAGKGAESMCLMTLGTGVGGGIIVHGKLVRGADGTAGEIGHIKVARDGRVCGCGSRGCLEAYGSAGGMVQTAVEDLESHRNSALSKEDVSAITAEMISEHAEEGDAYCREVVQETGRWLGLGIASLVNLLNPEKVILSGGLTQAGELLFGPIRETVNTSAFEVPARRVEIIPAGLGLDAGVIGAAAAAMERLESEVEP